MRGDTSDSSSYFDGREPDELIRALVQNWPGTDGKMTVGLHFLDLESNKVFIKAMPPDAPFCSTAVACGDHVYVIGGIRQNDATLFDYDGVNDVFQLDLKDLERGWRKTTSMLFPRFLPRVVAAEGKIFVFEYMGSESFGEVYDISGDIWEPLSPPPEDIDLCVPVLDSSRSRILVHCNANDTLYAYYYDRKS
ncbi:putative F-box/kelch-repeat protein At3g46050 [Gossypium raimondii]|uniref:putative F-box/kelch-repeat protein At3g46050 n=1 Tax=Gossypium raimondii TaxID=29730 RepID=UPI00227CAE59|nr:putative F-box/kelch-repeat protein At3g46050 [Gossypium raimondii]XP_052488449.1 putative F-box/kelch-repeat protein At3g46050 [Gossypium raimondii]